MNEKQLRKKVEKNTVGYYIKLVKWLYNNHKEVLREYEATIGKFRIEFFRREEMTELKTLKDLGKGIICKCGEKESIYLGTELKAEAAKGVKEIRLQNFGAQIPEILGENPTAKWIIHFFNLTEEDLK